MGSTSASYLDGPRFKSQSADQLSSVNCGFALTHLEVLGLYFKLDHIAFFHVCSSALFKPPNHHTFVTVLSNLGDIADQTINT